MKSLNMAVLIGNVTADASVKQTPSGTKVATFSIATNRVWKDAQGEKQEQATFHNIVAWSCLAEICEKFVRKGNPIMVKGHIDNRSWEKEDGTKGYRTEIVADDIILLGGNKITNREEPAGIKDEISIEDIPF